MDWALSFKLSYDLVNKNENALSALKREEYPKIYSIKLEEAQKGLKDGLRQINDTLYVMAQIDLAACRPP
ncbi:MAG: hypothetical protein SAMD01599839_15340 [Rectinema sp.]